MFCCSVHRVVADGFDFHMAEDAVAQHGKHGQYSCKEEYQFSHVLFIFN